MMRFILCLTLTLAFLPISLAEASAPKPATCNTSTISDFNGSRDYVCLSYENEKYIAYIGGVDYNPQHMYQLFVKKQKIGDKTWSPVGKASPIAEQTREVSLYVSEGVPYIAFTIININDVQSNTFKVMKYNNSSREWDNISELEDQSADGWWTSKSLFVNDKDIYVAYKRSQESKIAVFRYNVENKEKEYLSRIPVGDDPQELKNSIDSVYIYYKDKTIYVGSQTEDNYSQITMVRQYDPNKKEWSIAKTAGEEIKIMRPLHAPKRPKTYDYQDWIKLFKIAELI
ncbi:MAG: hypothetical protein NTY22_01145 [Proteobacteria bacterium]|nr:hypothetical protein [Pseudomonadota bacterium]